MAETTKFFALDHTKTPDKITAEPLNDCSTAFEAIEKAKKHYTWATVFYSDAETIYSSVFTILPP